MLFFFFFFPLLYHIYLIRLIILMSQKRIILEVRPFLEDSIKDAFTSGIPNCVKLADLGCASGPNALSAISEIIHTIHGMSRGMNCKSPEFQVFLNDLPGNDFNNIFSLLPDFYEKLTKEDGTLGNCFITGVPGSFYSRIFPSRSLDFVHSSCSVHWLSQAPAGLEKNKGHIYIANGSPPTVIQAYTNQFQRDFSLFLGLRSEEIKPGGRMVITTIGRSMEDPSGGECCDLLELLAKSLSDMLAEGLIEEADLNSLNFAFYFPSEGEVRALVQEEGSFNLDKLVTFEASWDPFDESDKYRGAQNVANYMRSIAEPTLTSHFGGIIIGNLFGRYADHLAKHLLMEEGKYFFMVISLTNK
ncbi:hypothetical protein PVL29_005034 [Vitis rotundifolia]|uniref:Uncharacterized protein n=2 Tax=Vitis rotundifolia TaxID=103349 RepID=A0AA39A9Q0_VITRO|nr:hypothetical protein PVL29_005034 [Vitis rotundifolia]